MRIGIMVMAALTLAMPGCARRVSPSERNPSSPTQTASPDARALLQSLGVEAYPNARPADGLNATELDIPEGTAYTTAWSTRDAPSAVIAFYKQRLRDARTNDTDMKDLVVGSTADGDSVTVVTSPDAKATLITITVRKSRY